MERRKKREKNRKIENCRNLVAVRNRSVIS
jgi:hypothetical protein